MIFNSVFYVIYFVYHQLYKLLLETMQQVGIVDDSFWLNPNYWRNKYDIKFWVGAKGKLIKKQVTGAAVPDYTDTKCASNTPSDCAELIKIAQVYVDTVGAHNLIKKNKDGKGEPHAITAKTAFGVGGAYYKYMRLWNLQDLASSTISRKVLNVQILAVMLFYLMTPVLNILRQARAFGRTAGIGARPTLPWAGFGM